MFKDFQIKKWLALGCLVGQGFLAGLAIAEQTTTTLQVSTGVSYLCDQDDTCDNLNGENEFNCVPDCGCNNDGVCQLGRGENAGGCPADCLAAPGEGGVISQAPESLNIENISVRDVSTNEAVISWTVTQQALCQVAWGLTQDYEQGVISEGVFIRGGHLAQLLNLNSSAAYHFQVVCQNIDFKKVKSPDWQFDTLSLPDTHPPANVSNLEAVSGDGELFLTWQNPADKDFQEVRIFRSEEFFPQDFSEGQLVYAGAEQGFKDTGLINGQTYYYTVFSYDQGGNYSSGATVWGMPLALGQKPPEGLPIKPPVGPAPPEVEKINLEDFSFWQEGNLIALLDHQRLNVLSPDPLSIAIDYNKVPEVLKTIMVTLKKGDKYFSFLLRIDKEKTKYTATLALPELGVYPMSIYVLDYKNQALKKLNGQLVINSQLTDKYFINQPVLGLWLQYLKQQLNIWIFTLMLLVVMVVLICRRAKQIAKERRWYKSYKYHNVYKRL